MSASRTQKSWLKPSEVISLSARVRELWTATPTLTTEQVVKATDAPRYLIENVRKRLLKAGVIARRWA